MTEVNGVNQADGDLPGQVDLASEERGCVGLDLGSFGGVVALGPRRT